MFTRAWPTGLPLNGMLTPTELNQLDIDHANAIDGAAGGDYSTISADVVFGGANSIRWKNGTYPKLSAYSITRWSRLRRLYVSAFSASDDWVQLTDEAGTAAGDLGWIDTWENTSAANRGELYIDVPFVEGAGIAALQIYRRGRPGGGDPTQYPTFQLLKWDPTVATLGNANVIGTATDDPNTNNDFTTGGYFDFAYGGLTGAETMTGAWRYALRVLSAYGASGNFPGYVLRAARFTFRVNSLPVP